MYRIIFFISFLFLISCNNNSTLDPPKGDRIEMPLEQEVTDYNITKDEWVNSVLDKEPVKRKERKSDRFRFRYCEIQYEEFKIEVMQIYGIPYEQKGETHIFITMRDGSSVLVEGDSPINKISTATRERIIGLAFQ